MSDKVRKLESDTEFLAVFRDETELPEPESVLEKSAESPLSGRDSSAPDGEKTIDAVDLANRVLAIAKDRHPQNETLEHLIEIYGKIDEAFENFALLGERRYADYEDHFAAVRGLKSVLALEYYSESELKEVEDLLAKIREEVFGSNIVDFLLNPNFQTRIYTRNIDGHLKGEAIMKNGKLMRNGNFVSVNADELIRLHKIPFALGLAFWNILAARPENLFELRNVRLKMKLVPHRETGYPMLIWDLLPAQPYEDAKERLGAVQKKLVLEVEEKERYRLADETPEIIDLEREEQITITEHSSFGIALLGMVGESLAELAANLKKMSKEDTENLPVIMVNNRGDAGEREWFGHNPKKSGKPAGLGWPGGSTESDKYGGVTDQDFRRMLPEQLFKEALASDLLYKIIGHFIREYQNESCHEVLKIFGRITRIQKGKNHVDHFWLIAAAREAGKPAKEVHEIKQTVCLTLGELFKLPVGGLDVLNPNQRNGLPYFGHLMVLVKFFKKHMIPLTDGMIGFLERAKIKR